MEQGFIRRAWIEIDLDRVRENYSQAKKMALPGVKVTCVIKSNAYGHGAVPIAKTLEKEGCGHFAVSCLREAFELRRHGIEGEILVMGLAEPDWMEAALDQELTLTCASLEEAALLSGAAQKMGKRAVLHMKVDTGFHRLGFPMDRACRDILRAAELPCLFVEGLYSHLGLISRKRDEMQHAGLMKIDAGLKAGGLAVPELHICDSIGMMRYPEWQHARVRTGALLFGVRPYQTEGMPFTCGETLAFKTIVAQIHQVDAGEPVGYSGEGALLRPSRIATLCAGYGDGYPRCMSNTAGVSIRGKLAPVVGLVCMDQMMADVTDIPDASPGDEAVLLGGPISYQRYADWARTNRNEAITILSRRPPRVYYQGGKIAAVSDELMGKEAAL